MEGTTAVDSGQERLAKLDSSHIDVRVDVISLFFFPFSHSHAHTDVDNAFVPRLGHDDPMHLESQSHAS